VLFSLFGEKVFHKGAAGIGTIWAAAAVGLIIGGTIGHKLGTWISYEWYKWTVAIAYLLHGITYVIFSQMEEYGLALVFIAASRAAVAVSSVMNTSQLLRHVADEYRGRVFSTIETMNWGMMMLSMTAAGLASDYYSPRTIGLWSGILSGSTAVFWVWAHLAGKLPEPPEVGVQPEEVEVHGDPNV